MRERRGLFNSYGNDLPVLKSDETSSRLMLTLFLFWTRVMTNIFLLTCGKFDRFILDQSP